MASSSLSILPAAAPHPFSPIAAEPFFLPAHKTPWLPERAVLFFHGAKEGEKPASPASNPNGSPSRPAGTSSQRESLPPGKDRPAPALSPNRALSRIKQDFRGNCVWICAFILHLPLSHFHGRFCLHDFFPAGQPPGKCSALPAATPRWNAPNQSLPWASPCQKTGQQAVSRAGGAPNPSFRCGQAVKVA